jgi:hypothetical protein
LPDHTLLEIRFIEGSRIRPPLDPPKIFLERQHEKKAAEAFLFLGQATPELGNRFRRRPDMRDDKVSVAEAPMVCDKQGYRRVQVLNLILEPGICRNKMISVEHDTLRDTFRERFRES